jgi:hypothetical protein
VDDIVTLPLANHTLHVPERSRFLRDIQTSLADIDASEQLQLSDAVSTLIDSLAIDEVPTKHATFERDMLAVHDAVPF